MRNAIVIIAVVISAHAQAPASASGAAPASASIRGQVVNLTTGAPLEIVLSAGVAVLEGTVVDTQGKPLDGAAVAILAKDGPLSSLKTGITDGSGKFLFDNFAPGEYQVLAWEDADLASFYEPGYLKGYEARAKPVKLEPSGRATVQVTALPAK